MEFRGTGGPPVSLPSKKTRASRPCHFRSLDVPGICRANPLTESSVPHPTPTNFSPRQQRIATGYLVLATVFWGCSFTWAKTIGDFANAALTLHANHPAGPILMVGFRFFLAAVLWFAIFPQSRRSWSMASVGRGSLLGVLMAVGMILQMLGLDLTTASVSSFITALTVLFVPLILMAWYRRVPSPAIWMSIGLATIGIWMLTGAAPSGFGLGAILALGCSIDFSFYLIAVNVLYPRDTAYRLTGLSFVITGLLGFIAAGVLIVAGHGKMDWSIVIAGAVWPRMLLLILFSTVASYGILTFFQPKIDATRATLIYLCEPIFTAIYDYIEQRHTLTRTALAGAALIILANVMVEFLGQFGGRDEKLIDGSTTTGL